MPLLPPPPAISLEQFKEVIKNGKTTMREIDPAFAKWVDDSKVTEKWQLMTIIVGITGLLFIFFCIAINVLRNS